MKRMKFIIVSLCLVCLLMSTLTVLSACVKNEKPSVPREPPVDETDEFDDFADIIDKSLPTAYYCDISYETAGVTLYGRYSMLFADIDGKKCAKLTYKYDKLNEIGSSDGFVSTFNGTFYAEGEDQINNMISSVSDGDNTAMIAMLSIKKDMFKTYSIVEKNEILTFSGKLVEDAFEQGVKDVIVLVEASKKKRTVSSFSFEYTDACGAKVFAKYTFSYETQNFEIG